MGKNIKYGEFKFSKGNERPSIPGYACGGMVEAKAKGGKVAAKPAMRGMKREPDAVVRKEVALLKKAGAPAKMIKHEEAEMPMGALGEMAGLKKGGKVHSDAKMDKEVIKKAVHKHEAAQHPGKPLTKLKRGGGVPTHNRKPMCG